MHEDDPETVAAIAADSDNSGDGKAGPFKFSFLPDRYNRTIPLGKSCLTRITGLWH